MEMCDVKIARAAEYSDKGYALYNGDCLDIMPRLREGSIDMILADPPYGTTGCKWDSVINIDEMWKQCNNTIKEHGCIALFGKPPFSSKMIMSNLKYYRYEWIWQKTMPVGFLHANKMPMRAHENISIFYKRLPVYNAQKTPGSSYTKKRPSDEKHQDYIYNFARKSGRVDYEGRFPVDVIKFSNPNNSNLHPTQKPVDLLEYLIKTYTNPGDTILDFCMGSGSTGVACANTGRRFVGIELDPDYYTIARTRIAEAYDKAAVACIGGD